MRYILLALFLPDRSRFSQLPARDTSNPAYRWADSVYQSLSPDERIGQLVIARLSSIDLKTRKVTFYDSLLNEMVRQYNIGAFAFSREVRLYRQGWSIHCRQRLKRRS